MLSLLVRALFLFALALLLFRRLFQGVFSSGKRQAAGGGAFRPGTPETRRGRVVQDPVCGMYLDETLAMTSRIRGETVYFCSEKCLQAYEPPASPAATNAK